MPSAQMVVATCNGDNLYALTFPRVTIEWKLPKHLPPMPIAINWGKLGEDMDLITLTEITFRHNQSDFALAVPAGYEYDGASIPRLVRWMPGYQRVGRHLWAATLHDWCCDHPHVVPSRVVGDALFLTLLLDTGIDNRQSKWMFRAVRIWSLYRAWKLGDETISHTAKECAHAPAAKAAAIGAAVDKAMSETSIEAT